MRWLRGLALFVAGTGFGVFMTPPSAAPQEKVTGLRLNHVGMYVKDIDESMNFYTKTMGFREAFSFKDKEGKPTLVYLQINRDTFLELAPASADRPVGFSHAGIWADDLKTTVAAIRQQGVKLDDPRTGMTNAPLTNVTDPNNLRLSRVAPEEGDRWLEVSCVQLRNFRKNWRRSPTKSSGCSQQAKCPPRDNFVYCTKLKFRASTLWGVFKVGSS